MAKLTLEQFKKWSSQFPEGWKFDAQYFVLWGEKRIYTDSTPNAKGVFYRLELEYKETYTRRMDQTFTKEPWWVVDRYTPTGENNSFCSVVRIISGNVGEPENKKNYNKLVKIAASLDPESYFKKAAEADSGNEYNSLLDFLNKEPEEQPAPEEAPEELTEKPEELTDPEPEEPAPAELTATEEETAEEPKPAELAEEEPTPAEVSETEPAPVEEEPEEEPKNPAPLPNYAELVKAYFTGGKPKKAEPEPKAEPKEEPKPAEPEPEEAPEEPYKIGYSENSNNDEFLTKAERESLTNGEQLARKEGYSAAVYSCVKYSENVSFLYRAPAHLREGVVVPSAGCDSCYYGFFIGSDLYTYTKPIAEKLREDIERRIQEKVPTEHAAAITAANVEAWEKEKIEECKQWEEHYKKNARELFFRGEKPLLHLYRNYKDFETDLIIDYLINPEKVVETEALRFICDDAAHIYQQWIGYARTLEEYNAITADPAREEHKMLRIYNCVKDEKTVRISLANGNEVKVEASAIKQLPFCNYISPWHVAASDRKLLDRNEYDRECDIYLSDVKKVSHGGRVLYMA